MLYDTGSCIEDYKVRFDDITFDCVDFGYKPNEKVDVVIRPEDVRHYEGIVPMMKLATRTHSNPRLVLEAYTSGKFSGNLFDLTEPGHGIFYRGEILDNAWIPEDYWIVKSKCKENSSKP